MVGLKSKSVFDLKRPVFWLALVIVVACFADWTQNRFDEKRSQEIKASMPPGSHLRISGSGPPTSTELLFQLRYAAGMMEPAKPKSSQSAFIFGNDSSDHEDHDVDQRQRSTFDRLTGSRAKTGLNTIDSRSSQFSNNPFATSSGNAFSSSSPNAFSSPQTDRYSTSQNSAFEQDPTTSRRPSGRDNESSSGMFRSDPN